MFNQTSIFEICQYGMVKKKDNNIAQAGISINKKSKSITCINVSNFISCLDFMSDNSAVWKFDSFDQFWPVFHIIQILGLD